MGPAHATLIDGAALPAWWGLPFAGLLLSIALMPLRLPRLWHHHFGKVAAGWAVALLLPLAALLGPAAVGGVMLQTLLHEYIPFIALLTALYTASGGIHLRGNLHGSPATNTAILGAGALLASLIGTTGAAMLLIRPLIRANDQRRDAAHVVVFFIFIVCNAGGALTPLGDPPLFLGFLQGIDFFWTTRHLLPHTAGLVGALLLVFWVLDAHRWRRDGAAPIDPTPDGAEPLGVDGAINLLPLAAVVALVVGSGLWQPGIHLSIGGVEVGLAPLLRDAGLFGVTLISLAITPAGVRALNVFSWVPMQEVAKLFAAIFLTMVPVLAMLKAGEHGALAAVARAVTGPEGQPVPLAYFWCSGLLSAFLDNAPTYLVFFNLAGGEPRALMGPLAGTLAAVSAGSVFMGALSYIGNAPNFMVKAIAEDRGIRMPSFFGYLLWSGAVLLPLFALMAWFGFA